MTSATARAEKGTWRGQDLLRLVFSLSILFSFCGRAEALDKVSEAHIAGLFASSATQSPMLTATSGLAIRDNDGGMVASAAYRLGNNRFLYAYQLGRAAGAKMFTAASLSIPVGTGILSQATLPSGAFWADAGVGATYTGPLGWFNSGQSFAPDSTADPISSVSVSPALITFSAPGTHSMSRGFAAGVSTSTPVFGFLTATPPTIVNGQFSSDATGAALPAIQLVVPTTSTGDPPPVLLDPVDVDPAGSLVTSGGAITSSAADLRFLGRVVSGVAADGVTQIVLRIPATAATDTFTLTLLNDSGAGSTSTAQDGALGVVGANPNQSRIQGLSAVPVGQTFWAFAIYRAPVDFVRADTQKNHPNDPTDTSRTVSVQITRTNADGQVFQSPVPIAILRPPVFCVHGAWSDPTTTFTNTDPTQPLGLIPRMGQAYQRILPHAPVEGSPLPLPWSFFYADYSQDVPNVVGEEPVYVAPLFTRIPPVKFNALGFTVDAPRVFDQLVNFIGQFKAGANLLQRPVAAVQADVVSHGMGGLVTRAMRMTVVPGNVALPPGLTIPPPDQVLVPGFFSLSQTFGAGYIHMHITIGTPHQGSPLANYLLRFTSPLPNPAPPAPDCVATGLATAGLESFFTVTLDTEPATLLQGAALQLSLLPAGGLTPLLTSLNTQPASPPGQAVKLALPTHLVAGISTNPNRPGGAGGVGGANNAAVRNLGLLCVGDPNNFLLTHLNSNGWSQVFDFPVLPLFPPLPPSSPPNDSVVACTSQLNLVATAPCGIGGLLPQPGAATINGLIHAPGLSQLGFMGPGETDSPQIAAEVIKALNTPVNSNDLTFVGVMP